MPYVVTRQKNISKKISIDDILFDLIDENKLRMMNSNNSKIITGTRTHFVTSDNFYKYSKNKNEVCNMIQEYIESLERFYKHYCHMDVFGDGKYNYANQLEALRSVKMDTLIAGELKSDEELIALAKEKIEKDGGKFNEWYQTFFIPKKKGNKYRRIDAPCDELKFALSELKCIFENMMGGNTYHTSAFAYIPNRSRLDVVKSMQKNRVRWILKLDFSNFFGSITLDFIMGQLKKIYPFSAIMESERGTDILEKCLHLCLLDGCLPQGTPFSPLISNIIMIPIDFKLTRYLNNNPDREIKFDKDDGKTDYKLMMARYADDIYISSHRGFEYKTVIKALKDILKEENAPIRLNDEKTQYLSISGGAWILGILYNDQYQYGIGHKNQERIRAAVNNICMDLKNGNNDNLDPYSTMITLGNLSNLQYIDPEYYKKMVDKFNTKFGFDVIEKIKDIAYARM